MNLLKAALYDPAGAVSKATSALLAMTAFDTTNLRLAITVPAHGMVRFRLRCAVIGATTFPTILLGVLNGATVVGRVSPVLFPGTANVATQAVVADAEFTATGLTPGAMNVDAAYGVEVVVAATNIKYGGPNNTTGTDAFGAFVFEAWDPQPQSTTGQLSVDANGRVDVIKIAGTTQTARDIGASVLLSAGSGTGQLDFTSGVVKANATQLLGTAWLTPGTAGTPDVNVKLWNALTTVALPLIPTVAGRTLDVSAGGEAGLDWANVGTPGSTVALSATTIGTVTTLTNLPAITANWLTATGINADAITAAKIADGAIDAATFAAGAINAAAIAADAIGASELAADAVTEIQSGLSTLTQANIRTAVGLASANLDTQIATLATQALLTTVAGYIDTEVASILTDTGLIKAKTNNLPATPAATGDAMALTAAAVDAILDEVVEGSTTMRQMLRLFAAALVGKASGMATTTAVFRDIGDTKARITATVDVDGNRSAVTLDSA